MYRLIAKTIFLLPFQGFLRLSRALGAQMDESEATTLFQHLLHQNASDVDTWLKRVDDKEVALPGKFNWLGLADTASLKARESLDREWAHVAIKIYERLAHTDRPDSSFAFSAMMLRAYMIEKLGHIANDPIQDVQTIIHWFLKNLTLNYQETLGLLDKWEELKADIVDQVADAQDVQRHLSLEDVRALRQIKNMLNVIEPLVKNGSLSPDKSLAAWLSIKDKLP